MHRLPTTSGCCLQRFKSLQTGFTGRKSVVSCPVSTVRLVRGLGWFPSAAARPDALPAARAAGTNTTTAAAAAAAATPEATGSPAARISISLKQLQHTASSLDAEPTLDGLLTAFQQLSLIQKQLQQECRQCKSALFRLRRAAAPRKAAAGLPAASGTAVAADAQAADKAQGQLAALNQLRASADDAQDFLLSLVHQLLQDQPPSACSQLLTSSAFRQLNVEALNRLAVNTFVDKQEDASPQDMAGLMAALALVRCCSSSNQVAGFERSQLSSLFSGIMSHLLAHVSHALQQQQQQPQQQAAVTRVRRRRQPGSAGAAETTPPAAAAAAAADTSVSVQACCQQVAAALAAHVSARVPFNSSLAPHVLHILQDEAPKWLHALSDVETAPSISHLAALVSHPSRYDYTYLAAALNRLAELAHQLQQQQVLYGPEDAMQQQQQQQRLAKVLVGRLRQLQADATAAELPAVLTAASKLGVQDGRFFATAASRAVAADNLTSATDAYLAAVAYVVATVNGGSSKGGMQEFTKQQQQRVLSKCLRKLVLLVGQQTQEQQQQQQQQQRQQQQQPGKAVASAAGGPITGTCPDTVAAAASASSSPVQPSNVLMTLWAAATVGLTVPKQQKLSGLSEYLADPAVVQQLTSAPAAADEVARSCGTIIWAAAQLGFSHNLDTLKPYMAAFLATTRAIPVSCSSILTVVLSLAALLEQQQQQGQPQLQQQQGGSAQVAAADARVDICYWQSSFLQCSQDVMERLQEQQQQQQQEQEQGQQPATSAIPSSAAAVIEQLLWAYQTAGLHLSDQQLAALQHLTRDQEPKLLAQLMLQRALDAAATVEDVSQHLLSTPGAAIALADLHFAAAVLDRVLHLQQQQQSNTQQAPGTSKAAIKQCCSVVSQHLVPAVQQRLASTADVDASGSHAADASSAAALMWTTSQLQYRDAALASACLQTFSCGLEAATAQDAAAVVFAMSEAGRAVANIYSCDTSTLHKVLAACTEKLLQWRHTQLAAQAMEDAVVAAAAGSAGHHPQHPQQDEAWLSGQSPAVLAQKVLQVHVAVGLQPSPVQTFELLSLAADEHCLSLMKDNAAAAVIVASLSAVAELSSLPGWQGISIHSSSSSSMDVTDSHRQTGASAVSAAGGGRGKRQGSRSQQLQFPWAWQSQQQQLLQEMWQQVLLGSLLQRLTCATAKQLSTALEAIVQLAGKDRQHGAGAGMRVPVLDIGLAKDFMRAVLDVLAPQPLSVVSGDSAGEQADAAGSQQGFLGGFRPGEWKGEHVAAVATAAAALDVSRPGFFAAVEADLLMEQQPAGVAGSIPQHHKAAVYGQQQQQQGKSRLVNVQLPHIISICCAAAALDCQVERLLRHAVQQTLALLTQNENTTAAAAAGATAKARPAANKQHTTKGGASEPELLLLLAWAVAVMDAPQQAQQAEQLVGLAYEGLKGRLTPPGQKAHQQQQQSVTALLQDVLQARMVQLHLWLLDRHACTSGGTGDITTSSSSLSAGLSHILSPDELQAAGNAWLALQRSSSPHLDSICDALGHLDASEQQELGCNAQVVADRPLSADVFVVLRGVPVAVLVLDDAEESTAVPAGGLAAAAAEALAADWLPASAPTGGAHSTQDHGKQQAAHAARSGPTGKPGSGGMSSSCQRLLAALRTQRVGDIICRTKLLTNRGVWVEVISSRQWVLLEGRMDAQVEFLRDRLWPLLKQEQEVNPDGEGAESVLAIEAAPVPQAA